MTKKEMITKIYYMLWINKDFEHDFKEEWPTAYKYFLQWSPEHIPVLVLKTCYKWMIKWKKLKWEK